MSTASKLWSEKSKLLDGHAVRKHSGHAQMLWSVAWLNPAFESQSLGARMVSEQVSR